MPVDEEGNVADIVMDPNSTISRMNLGRLYEQYVKASMRDTHKRLCAMLGIERFQDAEVAQANMGGLKKAQVDKAWAYLKRFYEITSPNMASWVQKVTGLEERIAYLGEVIQKGIGLYLPPDNPVEGEDMVLNLESDSGGAYKPVYGPVSYIGNSGNRVTTKANIRIASTYLILLEKIGDDWSAVSSGKLQLFAVLSQLTKVDKYAKPANQQAVRGLGEAEVRITANYVGAMFTAEMMDRNNNPQTHKVMVNNLVKAKYPSNVPVLVDRKVHPFGGPKPVQLVSHIAECGGFRFVYAPYKPNLPYAQHSDSGYAK